MIKGGDYVSTLSASLPEIEGETAPFPMLNNNTDGAFTFIAVSTQTGAGDGSAWTARGKMRFQASKSNAIYGASTTVQSPAMQMQAQVRF